MGKGARNKQNIDKTDIKPNKNKQRVKKSKIIIAVCVALAVVLGVGALWFALDESKPSYHTTVAVRSENYEITAPMMSYFFDMQYTNFRQTYKDSLDSIQLDTSTSLKEQMCDKNFAESETQTWYQFFYNGARMQVEHMLCMLEDAKKNGVKISSDVKDKVNSAIEQMKVAADNYDMTMREYLDYVYGEGTELSEIRTAMEYYQFSSNYYREKYGSTEYTDEQVQKYYDKNPKLFNSVGYMAYDFTVNIKSYGDDKIAVNAAKDTIRKEALQFMTVTSKEDYISKLHSFLTKYYKGNSQMTAEGIQEKVDNSVHDNAAYVDNDLGNWLFSGNAELNKPKLFEIVKDDVYYATVALMYTPMHRNETVKDFGSGVEQAGWQHSVREQLAKDNYDKLIKKFMKKYKVKDGKYEEVFKYLEY